MANGVLLTYWTLSFTDDHDVTVSDIRERELAQEIEDLSDLPSKQMTEVYPDLWIALRFTVTLQVNNW